MLYGFFTQDRPGNHLLHPGRNRQYVARLHIPAQIEGGHHVIAVERADDAAFFRLELQTKYPGDHLVGEIGDHFPGFAVGDPFREFDPRRQIRGLIQIVLLQVLLQLLSGEGTDLHQCLTYVEVGLFLTRDNLLKLTVVQEAHGKQDIPQLGVLRKLCDMSAVDISRCDVAHFQRHLAELQIFLILQAKRCEKVFSGNDPLFHQKLTEEFNCHVGIPLYRML